MRSMYLRKYLVAAFHFSSFLRRKASSPPQPPVTKPVKMVISDPCQCHTAALKYATVLGVISVSSAVLFFFFVHPVSSENSPMAIVYRMSACKWYISGWISAPALFV